MRALNSIGCIICVSLKINRNQYSIGCTCITCVSFKQGVILLAVNASPQTLHSDRLNTGPRNEQELCAQNPPTFYS